MLLKYNRQYLPFVKKNRTYPVILSFNITFINLLIIE